MASILVKCPECGGEDVIKHGKTRDGKQRFLCREEGCKTKTFLLEYLRKGWRFGIEEEIVELAMNGSGIRDTARVLKISATTVIEKLKKKESGLRSVNASYIEEIGAKNIKAKFMKVDVAAVDEMWSFVSSKKNQRWLWHAIDQRTGKILAYVFGRRTDEVFLELKKKLEPFGIEIYLTDYLGTYERYISAENHCPDKKNMQKIERKHLTLRTRIKRLARKTICFSKSTLMHDIVIGLFINLYEFGLPA